MGIFLTFLCLFGAYLLVINRPKKNISNIFLASYFFLHGIQLGSNFVLISQIKLPTILFVHFWPLSLLIGPSIYFYLKSIFISRFTFEKKDVIHLIPFLLCVLLFVPYYQLPTIEKDHIYLEIIQHPIKLLRIPLGPLRPIIFFYMRSIHVIVYLYIARAYQVRNKKEIQNLSIFQKRNLLRWVYMLLILTCLFQINAILFWANVQDKNSLVIANQFSLWTVLPLFIICIYMFINPFILYGFKQIRYYSTDSVLAKLFNDPLQKSKSVTMKTQKKLNLVREKINNCEDYKIPGLTIHTLAVNLEIPTSVLNLYFIEQSNESFTNWKNRRRIEFALEKIEAGFLKHSTLEELAKTCGFLSRSNFSTHFMRVKNISLKSFLENR